MNKTRLFWLAGVLTIVGSVWFGYKWLYMGYPVTPGVTADLWQVEIKLNFTARNEPIKAALHIPGSTDRFTILNENFVSRGYGLSTQRVNGNRLAIWSIRTANGPQVLYYRMTAEKFSSGARRAALREMPDVVDHGFEGAEFEVAKSVLQSAQQQSADLETMVAQLIKRANDPGDDNMALLLKNDFSPEQRISVVTRLLSIAYVPSRMLHGLHLMPQRGHASMQPWLEVFDDNSWLPFDPETGQQGMPDDYIVFWHGSGPLVTLEGADQSAVNISIQKLQREAVEAATARMQMISPVLDGLSLYSLPLATQNVYQIMLLVPIGAFLLVIMRNVIGIKTFGTFMPVLIALAFRETQLLWGMILFVVVVSVGLMIRFALDRLKLLLVPRLASVLTIVILLMLMLSIITNHFGIESGLSVALFPMVIITMTIERMSIVWDERGANEAIQQGIGSLFVAALAFIIMNDIYVSHLFVVFPELLLILLAGMLLLGRYSGYRLLELKRFKELADTQEPGK
jgi:hypothetical protein